MGGGGTGGGEPMGCDGLMGGPMRGGGDMGGGDPMPCGDPLGNGDLMGCGDAGDGDPIGDSGVAGEHAAQRIADRTRGYQESAPIRPRIGPGPTDRPHIGRESETSVTRRKAERKMSLLEADLLGEAVA